jgi:hypothetical protein
MDTKPLEWPVDWNKLSFFQRVFMWNPFFGKAISIHRDISKQLDDRTKDGLSQWEKYPEETFNLSVQVSEILISSLGWPKSSCFIPDDPAEIILWDQTGDLDSAEAVNAIEELVGVTMSDEFWEKLPVTTFSELLKVLIKTAEPDPGPYLDNARFEGKVCFPSGSGLTFGTTKNET